MKPEIEKFVQVEKYGDERYVLKYNPLINDLIDVLAQKHHLTHEAVVEILNARIFSLALREEEEGKQIMLHDPKGGSEKLFVLFKKNSS